MLAQKITTIKLLTTCLMLASLFLVAVGESQASSVSIGDNGFPEDDGVCHPPVVPDETQGLGTKDDPLITKTIMGEREWIDILAEWETGTPPLIIQSHKMEGNSELLWDYNTCQFVIEHATIIQTNTESSRNPDTLVPFHEKWSMTENLIWNRHTNGPNGAVLGSTLISQLNFINYDKQNTEQLDNTGHWIEIDGLLTGTETSYTYDPGDGRLLEETKKEWKNAPYNNPVITIINHDEHAPPPVPAPFATNAYTPSNH